MKNKVKVSEFLIENGACFYYEELKFRDLSPIFLAIKKQNTSLIEILCDHGANLTVKDSSGMTPLMYASSAG